MSVYGDKYWESNEEDKEMRAGERCYFGNSGLGRPY